MEIEQVLNDYRNGDEDKRLSLFLYYRDLRDEFSCIDRDMAADQSPVLWSPAFVLGNVMRAIFDRLVKKLFHRGGRKERRERLKIFEELSPRSQRSLR